MPHIERPAMADYGVPTDPEGALPWEWGEERLVANRNFWVVTVSAAGRPHALPVWGVWLPETDRFWFGCAPSSRKARNIAENAACVVAADDTVEVVSIEGQARIVDPDAEPEAVDAVIDAFVAKYWPDSTDREEHAAFLLGNALVKVTPDRAFGIIEREDEFSQRATRWRW